MAGPGSTCWVVAANTMLRLMAFAAPMMAAACSAADGDQLWAACLGPSAQQSQSHSPSVVFRRPLDPPKSHVVAPIVRNDCHLFPDLGAFEKHRPRALISCLSSFISEFSLGQTAPTKPAIHPLSPPCPSGLSRLLRD